KAEYLAKKIMQLRVFPDENGKMNLSIQDVGGEILVISQFTLYGDCRKGNRPSYTKSAPAEQANDLYGYFVEYIESNYDITVKTGEFQADMKVDILNDGPVTLIVESRD
ncbi:MAG: D-aminoacyl-tRNA deacylase, partial [Clostridia bacterium]|nr:D-aminoacyl-tRNA deacylase [Clostridia bacterium]